MTGETTGLKKSLGFGDLLLFYIATTFSLRWMATAAAAGPSALVIWIVAAAGLFVPLVFAVLELSSRYPEEGGIYIWTKRAFGPFAGFITGWTYWSANLPYFPSLLYFTAGNALFMGGPSWQAWSANSTYFATAAMAGLLLTVVVNVVGLDVAKWLSNAGAVSTWVPASMLIVLGLISWARFGSATPMPIASFVPRTGLKDVIFWSTIAFAYGGVEGASILGDEIRDARRLVPRAVVVAGLLLTIWYILGTLSVLLAVPRDQISNVQGIMQAIQAMTARTGTGWLAPMMAALITISGLGGVGAWFAATSRLPFVAGVDRFLPKAFASLHPKWKTPHVALLVQAAVSAVFVLLGQAGTSVRGAYEVLVSMSIITYFIPYLFMFAALIRLQREPVGPEVIRVPGGRPIATLLGVLGFLTTAVSIVLACVPSDDDPNKMLAVVKVVGLSMALVAIGAVVYVLGRRSADAGR